MLYVASLLVVMNQFLRFQWLDSILLVLHCSLTDVCRQMRNYVLSLQCDNHPLTIFFKLSAKYEVNASHQLGQ